jgi:3-deoxy-D-manno-octulosonate 8-phosphate phosphatase (KDO 8-P phosphatase)
VSRLSRGQLVKRAKRVRVFLLDIDGVLTGGLIYHLVDNAGRLVEFKGVHAHDSIALHWLAQEGIRTGVISGRNSEGMAERLKLIKVSFIHQGRLDKKIVFEGICREAGVSSSEVLYMGDDLPDIPVLREAGIAVTVPQARAEVKAASHWVTRAPAGAGAVREVVELVLAAQGKWEGILAKFEAGRPSD